MKLTMSYNNIAMDQPSSRNNSAYLQSYNIKPHNNKKSFFELTISTRTTQIIIKRINTMEQSPSFSYYLNEQSKH